MKLTLFCFPAWCEAFAEQPRLHAAARWVAGAQGQEVERQQLPMAPGHGEAQPRGVCLQHAGVSEGKGRRGQLLEPRYNPGPAQEWHCQGVPRPGNGKPKCAGTGGELE